MYHCLPRPSSHATAHTNPHSSAPLNQQQKIITTIKALTANSRLGRLFYSDIVSGTYITYRRTCVCLSPCCSTPRHSLPLLTPMLILPHSSMHLHSHPWLLLGRCHHEPLQRHSVLLPRRCQRLLQVSTHKYSEQHSTAKRLTTPTTDTSDAMSTTPTTQRLWNLATSS